MTDQHSGNGGGGAGQHPIGAVCCEGADVLALYDLVDGSFLGEVGVGGEPVHATVVDDSVFVATMGARSVDAVDTDGMVHRVETGVLGPSHFAATGGELWVPCTAGDVVAVLDPAAFEREHRVAVGAEPHEIEIHDGFAYVGSRAEGVVSVVDTACHETVGELDLGPTARVQGVDIHPASGRGFAVDQRGARVVAFEPGSGPEQIGEVAVGADPYDIDIVGDRLFVPGRDDGVVHEFGPELRSPVVHEGFERPVAVLVSNGSHWVLDRGRDRIESLEGDTVSTPAPAIGGTVTDGGILLSHYDDGAVSLVDPREGVRWHRQAPANPFGSVVV